MSSLNTLSPDVVNTWCTDRKREQSVSHKEDWQTNKAEHNKIRDSKESRARSN